MTTTTDRPRTQPATAATAATGVTQRRVLAAEVIKLRSTRSARWLLAVSAASIVAAGVFPALGVLLAGAPPAGAGGGSADPTGGALSGVSFTQLLVAALGILVVTSEYATGLIRATFTAVPKRLPVLWAKAVVVAAATFVVTVAAAFVTFVTAQAVLSAADVTISLAAPGVLRALVGSALFLALTGAMAVAFGSLLRSAVGAMAAVFGLLYVLPLLGLLVPQLGPYLSNNAGAAIMQIGSAGGGPSPWMGLGIFGLYTAAALTAAAFALTRRDA
jgi:ABC-type transport system involved in multi-copper enzyme maturation permease subunit